MENKRIYDARDDALNGLSKIQLMVHAEDYLRVRKIIEEVREIVNRNMDKGG